MTRTSHCSCVRCGKSKVLNWKGSAAFGSQERAFFSCFVCFARSNRTRANALSPRMRQAPSQKDLLHADRDAEAAVTADCSNLATNPNLSSSTSRLDCAEASRLYMALYAHARHISGTFGLVMSLQVASMLLSTTVTAIHIYRDSNNAEEHFKSFDLSLCVVGLSIPLLFAPLTCVATCNAKGARLTGLMVRCSPVEKAHSDFDLMPIVVRASACPVTITFGGVTVNPVKISCLSILYFGYYSLSAYSRGVSTKG